MTYFYKSTNKEDNICQQQETRLSLSVSSRSGQIRSVGGVSPATSEVTITNSSRYHQIVHFMGVDGSYQQTLPIGSKTVVHVPIMSNIYFVSRAQVSGGMSIFSLEDFGNLHNVICVTEPTCSINLSS